MCEIFVLQNLSIWCKVGVVHTLKKMSRVTDFNDLIQISLSCMIPKKKISRNPLTHYNHLDYAQETPRVRPHDI